MKKAISLLLALIMVMSLVACGGSTTVETDADGNVAMQYITIEDAKTKMEDDGYVFFDIRKTADSSEYTVPGAQAWDMDAAKEGDAEAGKATMTEATKGLDKNIVLVCYSGKRYAQAATNALAAIGYDMSKVWTLEGGFTAWSEQCPELVEVLKELRTDIVMYSSADIGTLDPMVAKTGADTIVVGLAYDNLVEYIYEYAEDGSTVTRLRPQLAESWEFSDDNMSITFHLKKGVKFHNGEEMTAADVVYSLDTAVTSETKAGLMVGYVSAEATDDYTVVVTLSSVVPTLLYNYSQIPVLCKSYMENGGTEAIATETMGTGPYKFVDHQVAQSFTLEAFEEYHAGAAQIKTVRYDIIADSAAALLAFEAGSFDFFRDLGNTDVDRIADSENWNTVVYDTAFPRCVYLNHKSEIFDDVKVRQAMAYATNKENIVALAQGGKGSAADSFFHPELFVNASAPDVVFNYDLDKAKALLAEAGYPNGEGIPTLKLETMETHQQFALAVQQDYAELGIEVELVFTDANTFVGDLMNGNYDLAINVAGLSNFVYPWGRIFESQYLGQTNFAQVNDPVIDELFAKIGVTMDDEEQKTLIHELINYITENVTYLPLAYANNNVAYAKDLVLDVHPMSADPYYMHWA